MMYGNWRDGLALSLTVVITCAIVWVVLWALLTAVLAHGSADWIAKGRYKNLKNGEQCCGVGDCREVFDVQTGPDGYVIPGQTIPYDETQPSPAGYWVCMRPDGVRRCFFAPFKGL